MLLQTQIHALSNAACALYTMIGDLEQTPCDLHPQQAVPAEIVAREGEFGCRAGAPVSKFASSFAASTPISASTPREALLQKLLPRLEAVTESIVVASSRCRLCCPPRAEMDALVGVLVAITQETGAMVTMLEDSYGVNRLAPVLAGIRALEMRGDRVFRQATARLDAAAQSDLPSLARWHGAYEAVAQAIRQCGQIAMFVANSPQPPLR